MTKIAINGLGRIGRAVFKQLVEDGAFELVAVNDLASAEELAYLLKHDSVYGRYELDVRAENGRLVVGDQSCVALNEKNLAKLPWSGLAVGMTFEVHLPGEDARALQDDFHTARRQHAGCALTSGDRRRPVR